MLRLSDCLSLSPSFSFLFVSSNVVLSIHYKNWLLLIAINPEFTNLKILICLLLGIQRFYLFFLMLIFWWQLLSVVAFQ